jgi:hypothetical protein
LLNFRILFQPFSDRWDEKGRVNFIINVNFLHRLKTELIEEKTEEIAEYEGDQEA